jgi:glycosyltransferase involved in cell wall biosynthesis
MGCSPTKLAEYLACGLPVISNADFGDQRELAPERETCVLVESLDDAELERGADRILALAARPLAERVEHGRKVAAARFGLETVGIPRYERLYEAVAGGGRSPSSR